MLWAENLLLLLTDQRSGRLVAPWNRVDLALAGSVLGQLSRQGRIGVDHPGRPRRPGRIRVLDASPTGDDILDPVVAMLAETPRRPVVAIHRIKQGIRRSLYDRLAQRGVVGHRTGRTLLIVPVDEWPPHDPAVTAPFAGRLAHWWSSAPFREATGDDECSSASALLEAIGAIRPVAGRIGLAGRYRTIRQLAVRERQASWVATAVYEIYTANQARTIAQS